MMIRKIKWLPIVCAAVVICFSIVGPVYSQSIQTSIDRKDILIGEQINYRLQFTLPSANYTIEFNVPDSFEHFEILNKVKSDSTDKKGGYLVFQNIQLTSWDSGQWAIPSFPIKIRNTSGAGNYTLNTDQVMINVGYAPADSTGQLRDIKPVMEVFYIDRTWIYITAGVVLGLILLYLLYRYFRKRPKKEKPIFNSKLSPFDEAMQALKNLQSTNLYDEPAIKAFHTSLAEILKKFYSRVEGKNLLNRTTDEILMYLRETRSGSDTISTLAGALRSGDAVKFAKYLPPVSESEFSLQQVKMVIEQLNKNQPKT